MILQFAIGEIEIGEGIARNHAVSRTEYELKDELVRETIMNNAKNIDEIKTSIGQNREPILLKSDENRWLDGVR
jgi:hypothetical protein